MELGEWTLEDAIQHHREKIFDGGKLPVQLVINDCNSLANAEHKGKKEAPRKILSTIEVRYI